MGLTSKAEFWNQIRSGHEPLVEKPATRFKGEIIDLDDTVIWDALVHEEPPLRVRAALASKGLKFRRANKPSDGPAGPDFSELDPENSIEAAYEHHDRSPSQRTRVLMLLLAHAKGPDPWVTLKDLRRVGGEHGDKRGRELRDLGWPVEKRPAAGKAWDTSINLNGISPRVLRGARARNSNGTHAR